MKQLGVYLTFAGNCEEALNFYANCFGEVSITKQTFGESPMPSEGWNDKIMHAEFKADGVHFMASDSMKGGVVTKGDSITLSIVMDNEDEQTRIFNALSAGGKVIMPLDNTFWGARFGMLTDKFGNNWMLNCLKQQ